MTDGNRYGKNDRRMRRHECESLEDIGCGEQTHKLLFEAMLVTTASVGEDSENP